MNISAYAQDIAAWLEGLADEWSRAPQLTVARREASRDALLYAAEHLRQDIPSLIREEQGL